MLLRIIFILFLGYALPIFAQRSGYDSLVIKANTALANKDFDTATMHYTAAFMAFGGRAFADDRYNAAKAFAANLKPDSAFFHLQRLYDKTEHLDYNILRAEPMFTPLHAAPKWSFLLEKLKPTMPELVAELHTIHDLDQNKRRFIDTCLAKFGHNSPEYKALWQTINRTDSINQVRIFELLDRYGWLGRQEVGGKGASAVFLVVQHADLAAQEKYVPLMRTAAANGNAQKSSLAMLEDRILMRNNKKQRYGTQQRRDNGTSNYYYYPTEDPENLNKRRLEIGMSPLSDDIIAELKRKNETEK
jgi:hypothetical protein